MKSRRGNSLKESCFQFAFHITQDAAKATEVAELLEEAFDIGEHFFLTLCLNLDDGIGDYISQTNFIELLKTALADKENVRFQNISFISDTKLMASKFVRESTISDEDVVLLNRTYDGKLDKQNIIGIPNKVCERQILQMLLEADFILNIAIKLGISYTYKKQSVEFAQCAYNPFQMQFQIKDTSFVRSWTQYDFKVSGPKRPPYIETQNSYHGPLFLEQSMGCHEEQMGIRFIDNIVSAVNEDKTPLLKTLSKEMRAKLHCQSSADLNNQGIAIGYLQAIQASQGFALIAAQTSLKTGDMNVFVNTEHFKEQFVDRTFYEKIMSLGYSKIEIVRGDQVQTNKLNLQSDRTLRLIEFKGTSEADKEKLHGLSTGMIACSGDTSFSEVISAGLTNSDVIALPFLQLSLTSSNSCILSLLHELEILSTDSGEMHAELNRYLNYFERANKRSMGHLEFKHDMNEGEWIKENREKIAQSWKKLCQFLHTKRDIKHNFNELLVSYIFNHLIKHHENDKVLQIARLLGKNALKQESLLHLAVKLNNVELAKQIIDEKIVNIDQTYAAYNYTALHLAVHYNSLDMVKLLVEKGANLNCKDLNGRSALVLAEQKELLEISNYLNPKALNTPENKNLMRYEEAVEMRTAFRKNLNADIEADSKRPPTIIDTKKPVLPENTKAPNHKIALTAALDNLQKDIQKLQKYGQKLRRLGLDTDQCHYNTTSKEFIKGTQIANLVYHLNVEVEIFKRSMTPATFKTFSTDFSKQLNTHRDELETHRDLWVPYAIVAGNLLFALTVIGALVLAVNATYALTTKEGLTLHSGFFGMKTGSEKRILSIDSDLEVITDQMNTAI